MMIMEYKLKTPTQVTDVQELARDEEEVCRIDMITVSREDVEHKEKLLEILEEPNLPKEEKSEVLDVLAKRHGTFSMEP